MKILLVDYGDAQLTSETSSIAEDIFAEYGFNTDNVEYAHVSRKKQVGLLPQADVTLAMGAEALSALVPEAPPLKKMSGVLTWSQELGTWVLPTEHPNCIYVPDGKGYGRFDTFYDHTRRAIDLCQGTLPFPPKEGHKVDWEFVGHNGEGWDPYTKVKRPVVWSGYFEATDAELDRQFEILNNWLHRLHVDGPQTFAADTESYDLDFYHPLTMIQIYDPWEKKAYAFTWGVIEQAKELWQDFFCHENARFVWHNIQHDAKMLRHWLGVLVDERHDDTLCWALGLTEKGNQTGLKYCSRQYNNAGFYEEGLDDWLDKDNINYGHIRPDILAEYGCLDVFHTDGLASILPPLVEREGTRRLVCDILLPAARTFAQLSYAGIRVDKEYAEALKKEWAPLVEAAIKEVQDFAREMGFPHDPGVVKNQIVRQICSCVPVRLHQELDNVRVLSYRKYLHETHGLNPTCDKCNNKRYIRRIDDTLNVNSSTQMQHLCFDVLGMDETYEGRKTNKYFWKLNPSHELTKLVMEYREMQYLSRNLIDGFGKFILEDGRVHPNILLFGTVTGRLAIREPAVQTIPKHSKNAKAIRRIFLPDLGDVIIDVDYSNLELYMAHHLTGDEALLEALQKDLHRMTASAMYLKSYEEVSDAERQSAKPVNFGAGYNIGAGKLSRDINLIGITGGEKSKAQAFLDAFWSKYTTWDKGRHEWMREALENCELRTELGRVRRWNLITKDNLWKVNNQACNFKGQSMASDLCLTSLIRLQDRLTELSLGRVMLTVHDSLVFSIHKDKVHEAVPIIREIMTTPIFETTTPFKVDVQVGPNYGDMDAYDPNNDYALI